MKVKKSTNTNMKFFYGSVFFFAIVVVVILLFTYFVFKDAALKSKPVQPAYQFALGSGFDGQECRIMLEDSVLYASDKVCADTLIMARRFVTGEEGSEVTHFVDGSGLVVEVPGVDTLNTVVGKGFFYRLDIVDGQLSVVAEDL